MHLGRKLYTTCHLLNQLIMGKAAFLLQARTLFLTNRYFSTPDYHSQSCPSIEPNNAGFILILSPNNPCICIIESDHKHHKLPKIIPSCKIFTPS